MFQFLPFKTHPFYSRISCFIFILCDLIYFLHCSFCSLIHVSRVTMFSFDFSRVVEMFILVPKIFSFCIWTSLNDIFFKFRFHVLLPIALVAWSVYFDFPTRSSSLPHYWLPLNALLFFIVNSMELRSGCWSILKNEV